MHFAKAIDSGDNQQGIFTPTPSAPAVCLPSRRRSLADATDDENNNNNNTKCKEKPVPSVIWDHGISWLWAEL